MTLSVRAPGSKPFTAWRSIKNLWKAQLAASPLEFPNSFLGSAACMGFKNAVRVLQFSTQPPSRTAKLFLLSPTARSEFRKVLAEALQETAHTATLNRARDMTEVHMKTERPARQLRCSDYRGWKGRGWLWRGAQNYRRAHTNTVR